MMAAAGVLEEIRPADLFPPDAGELARPGSQDLRLIAVYRSKVAQPDPGSLADTLRAAAERDRERAQLLVNAAPSSITYAALAQVHASLNEHDEAVAAAVEAINRSVSGETADGQHRAVLDPSSARIAAEVLQRFGRSADAYEMLDGAASSPSLSLTRAILASELGRFEDAFSAIEDQTGSLFEAFRGYLLASNGEYQKAIPHLRFALREVPDDADSALNLSISLWHIGARRKATSAALRATRTSPARKDISVHYMELLLAQGDLASVERELRSLRSAGVTPDSTILVIRARVLLARGQAEKALPILERALKEAEAEGDAAAVGEISSNRVVIRHDVGKLTIDQMARELDRLLDRYPDNDAVVVNYARAVDRRSQAGKLRSALKRIEETTTPDRRAFLQHYIAFLEGDNETAGSAGMEWFDNAGDDPRAAAGALVAVGIGLERWEDAAKIADFALTHVRPDPIFLNNVAYVFAMVGRGSEGIQLLKEVVARDEGFVLRATYGLAHLSVGRIEEGMRYYREAAERAERVSPVWCSLMTIYQALIVRQLGLDEGAPHSAVSALALAPYGLPEDWEDRPDFLRLKFVCDRHGYPWPLEL